MPKAHPIGRNIFARVGRQFSVTRERIRQIEAKALRKLKHLKSEELSRRLLEHFGVIGFVAKRPHRPRSAKAVQ
jgi:hypothetical protein